VFVVIFLNFSEQVFAEMMIAENALILTLVFNFLKTTSYSFRSELTVPPINAFFTAR